jgi:hypothetical protein
MSSISVPSGFDLVEIRFRSTEVTDASGSDLEFTDGVRPRLVVGEAFQQLENSIPNEEDEPGTVVEALDRSCDVAQSDSLPRDWCGGDVIPDGEIREEPMPGELAPGNRATLELSSEDVHYGMVGRENRR